MWVKQIFQALTIWETKHINYILIRKNKYNLYLYCIMWPYSYCKQGPSLSWSYGSWIYNYLCNQCLSPLMLWVWIPIRERCTTLCDKVCQWRATGRWFSPGPTVSSSNKIDRHDITEILLKVALNTIKQTNQPNLSPVIRSINSLIFIIIWWANDKKSLHIPKG